ncbi:MAG: DNA-3-methyladenine glycosylase 2 [Clostridia bacterium]|nr:DNA-3-methyladenine glycosylase 2 [Clostridia bacterium]
MEKVFWDCPDFSLSQTLECGQCFRYQKEEDDCYTVICGQRVVTLGQEGGSIVFYGGGDIPFWKGYFDGDRSYGEIKQRLCNDDPIMAEAVSFAPGIRILRQEFFEMLISFILSQNNHIPRIRGLIQRLCREYGMPVKGDFYSFPTPIQLSHVSEEAYRSIGCGFRSRYMVDAVDKVLAGGFSTEELEKLSTDALRQRLMSICGVGQKVADCILLFSFGRYEVFPTDVWINRVFSHVYCAGEKLSPKELQKSAAERFGEDAGFAQQYLFHYGRKMKIGKE